MAPLTPEQKNFLLTVDINDGRGNMKEFYFVRDNLIDRINYSEKKFDSKEFDNEFIRLNNIYNNPEQSNGLYGGGFKRKSRRKMRKSKRRNTMNKK
jgi:hypothetical protein